LAPRGARRPATAVGFPVAAGALAAPAGFLAAPAGFLAALGGCLGALALAVGALAVRGAVALLVLAFAPEAARVPAAAFVAGAALTVPVARCLPVPEAVASLGAGSGAVVAFTAASGWAARLLLRRWGRERGSAPSTLAPSSLDEDDVGRCSLMIVGSPACAVVNFR
jgi:hypothetical protein